MKSGIYRITCGANGRVYVGSATNVHKRWNDHRRNLKGGYHDNSMLQNAWNKYGESTFTCDVLEYVEPSRLIEREKYFIKELKAFDKDIGFNLAPVAGSMLGFKHNEQSLDKMAAAKVGRKQSPEHIESRIKHQRGRKHSAEEIQKRADAQRGVPRKPQSAEARAKQVAAMRGKRPKNLESLWSPEVVAKRQATKRLLKAKRSASQAKLPFMD